jgi:signal transduction histidine kinase
MGVQRFDAQARWTILAAVLLGIVAEAVAFAWQDIVRWLPDLLAGWVLVGAGVLASSRRPESRTGALLVASGIVWFAGNFAAVAIAPIATAASLLTFLHRALLMHVVLTLPGGRIPSRVNAAAIVAGYVAWLMPFVATSPVAVAAIGMGFVGTAAFDLRSGRPGTWRVRRIALVVALLLSATYLIAAVIHVLVPSGRLNLAVLIMDQGAVVASGLLALYAVLLPRLDADRLTDLVTDVQDPRADGVRDALARALGDPSLVIGYWDAGSGGYLDGAGATLDLQVAGAGRMTTRVDLDGEPVALLVHESILLRDPSVAEPVFTITRLAAANARLRANLLQQVAQVRASRHRLLAAGDAERRTLERRLESDAMPRAEAVARALERLDAAARESSPSLDRARDTMAMALADLGALARGLHPRLIDESGLEAALRSLVAGSSIPVDFSFSAGDLPDEVRLAVYFVAAEALANAAKHSGASRITLRVRTDDAVVVIEIDDDGVGGADLRDGTGFRGVADRVDATGGRLTLRSEPGAGTLVRVLLPTAGLQ